MTRYVPSEGVRRVADAIASQSGSGMDDASAVQYALAAIEAMREPTEAMVDAAWQAAIDDGMTAEEGCRPTSVWLAMIDQLLK